MIAQQQLRHTYLYKPYETVTVLHCRLYLSKRKILLRNSIRMMSFCQENTYVGVLSMHFYTEIVRINSFWYMKIEYFYYFR